MASSLVPFATLFFASKHMPCQIYNVERVITDFIQPAFTNGSPSPENRIAFFVSSRGQGLRCSIDDLYEQFVVPIDEIQPKKYNWGKRQIRHTDEVIEWTSPNKRAQSDH